MEKQNSAGKKPVMEQNLSRFVEAQEKIYSIALEEIKSGCKQSHWMWFIFPQIQGLGHSSTSQFYAIKDFDEASDYLKDKVLGSRLIEISKVLLKLETDNARKIFGSPDHRKLRSSMTLFSLVPNADPVFQAVLDKFFEGSKDRLTIEIIEQMKLI